MADLTLKCSAINGGTAVNLQANSVTYNWNNFVHVPDVGGSTGDPVVVVDHVGNTVPKIIIKGIINTNDAASNSITFALLKLFAQQRANDIFITDGKLFPVADTDKVVIRSFSMNSRYGDDINEGRIDYSLELVETN